MKVTDEALTGPAEGLLSAGKGDWKRFCGFLDMTPAQFRSVQSALLHEQLRLVSVTPAGQRFVPGGTPVSIDSFRTRVPLTTYEDYRDLLGPAGNAARAFGKVVWTKTYYGPGIEKWVPFTVRGYQRFLDNIMASLILATAERPGDVRIGPGAYVMCNLPPRPYLTGLAAFDMARRFGLRSLLPLDELEHMDFGGRIRAQFEAALTLGVDAMVSLTSILLKISERFEGDVEKQTRKQTARRRSLGVRGAARVMRARLSATVMRRSVQPRDLWRPRGIVGWGLETKHCRFRLAAMWDRLPFEVYGATEGGILGMQATPGGGLVFSPHSNFFEFIPEEELPRERNEPGHQPETVLLDEVKPGKSYELVITNFYGMPLLRYRLGHMVRFLHTQSSSFGPDFEYQGRADERVDIAGFTRMDEATVWRAFETAGVRCRQWAIRREDPGGPPLLRIYMEKRDAWNAHDLAFRLHEALSAIDPLYRSVEEMLGWRPLEVTFVPPGAFDSAQDARLARGTPLALAPVPRMNADSLAIEDLLRASEEAEEMAA